MLGETYLNVTCFYIYYSLGPVGGLVGRPQPRPGLFEFGLRSFLQEFLQAGGVLAVEVGLPIVLLVEVWRSFPPLRGEELANHSLLCKAFC